MKKKLLILAVAGLALASCSNDQTVATQVNNGANEISFRTNVNGVTRAADIDAGTGANGLKTIGFYVTAAYTTATPTLYFHDEHYMLASSNPSDVWKPTDDNGSSWKTIYWPEGSDVLDFHAYAPATGTQLSVSNTIESLNGCPVYTVTPAATTNATSADTQIDFVYATLTNKDQGDGSMNLDFNHKESKISINLKNTDAALTITVSEVALCNITQSGVFKNRNAAPTTTTTMEWGDFGALTTYYQTLTSPTTYTSSAAAGSSWILIPHPLANPTTDGEYTGSTTGDGYNGAYIRVKMKVQSATDANVYYAGAASGANEYVSAIWPISTIASTTTWLAGTHYTYTVDLAGGGYYETNQATPSGATLDRVLNLHEITFATVTVTDWTPSNSDV